MNLTELKKYIEECDKYGHSYFTYRRAEDFGGICNNHVLYENNPKQLVKELNQVLEFLADNRHIDKIYESIGCTEA